MNEPKYKPTLCVGADVHKDEIVLRAVTRPWVTRYSNVSA